jgi:hypothetical protein
VHREREFESLRARASLQSRVKKNAGPPGEIGDIDRGEMADVV